MAANSAAPPPAPKLSVEGLTKVYGDAEAAALGLVRDGVASEEIQARSKAIVAVRNVSFDVQAGEIFVVMGLSGSGKSTLIRCLNRLVEPTAGRILVDGTNICALPEGDLRELRLRRIAMVFQNVALLPHRSVVENVEFGLKIRGLARQPRRAAALAALDQVGLSRWASHRPAELSGGMQQRVGLARALAVDPDILLMDEPFSALDPLIRGDMQHELLTLQRELKKTIIFITHDLNEALTLGKRIAIMKDGRFIQVGRAAEIVSAPVDDYVAAFTRTIDRARVLTVRTIMRAPHIVSAQSAVGELLVDFERAAFILDLQGRPAGLVRSATLAAATRDRLVAGIADPNFRCIAPDANLLDVYALCGSGDPVAVVGDDGRLIGVLRPLDVFAALAPGKPEATPGL
jgi:glycine betaine/proline transport system ATP-binding protein